MGADYLGFTGTKSKSNQGGNEGPKKKETQSISHLGKRPMGAVTPPMNEIPHCPLL